MKIGIIGSGHIGGTLARHFVDAGHEVAVSNSRGPETLTGFVEDLGGEALWLQRGIRSPQTRQIAITAGLDDVEDKCLGTIGATMHSPGGIGRQ